MARNKTKVVSAALPVPQSDDEAREAIRELGDLGRDALRLQADMNDGIAALQQSYGEAVAPITNRQEQLTEGLRVYAEANRMRLTRDGKVKFAEYSTGKISWRIRPAKVTLKKLDEVIARIKQAGLAERFLRTKEEINKEAMLEHKILAAGIKGVSIGSDGEDFIVEPFETDLTEAR